MVNQAHTDEPILSSGWWLTASFGSSLCESEYSHPLLSPTITGQLAEVLSALSCMVRSIRGFSGRATHLYSPRRRKKLCVLYRRWDRLFRRT